MKQATQYYNAKPSNISNIGLDITGARRMHFDTYETTEEKEAKQKKKVTDKALKVIKEQIKTELALETPDVQKLIILLNSQFEKTYSISAIAPNAKELITGIKIYAEYNKVRKAYNKLHRLIRELNSPYYVKYAITSLRNKYKSKESFTEESGAHFNWKNFISTEYNITSKINFLGDNSNAVQFGNSVSDKERAYILNELFTFITQWQANSTLSTIDLKPIGWSFGARGKASSVAYYQPSSKLISVNRDRIGSLIHEIGHYIDHINNDISYKISYSTVNAYRESIKDEINDRKTLQYYCKKEEIFARAFEAYCFRINANFSDFAQVGKAFLPELNEELISLIELALNKGA